MSQPADRRPAPPGVPRPPVGVTPGQAVVERSGDRPPVDGTGHPVVDEVLDSLSGLEERPLQEHVGVLETAHERLRAALSDVDVDVPAPGA